MTIPPAQAGIGSAMAAALGGLNRAGARAAGAAERIAGFGSAPPVAGPPEATARAGFDAAAAAGDADPARAVTDLLLARRAYQANALVLSAADEMAGELLRAEDRATPPRAAAPAGGR